MRKIILTTVVFLISSQAWAQTSWDSAVEIYSENSEIKPYKMHVYSETYDRKGRLEKINEQFYTLSYNADGETEQELIKALENGKEISKEQLEKERRSRRNSNRQMDGMEGMDKMPLDAEHQDDVIAAYSGIIENKNGIECELWDFEIILSDKYTGIGRAWLNTENGRAVSLSYQIDPLFPFVEKMDFRMDFDSAAENSWVMESFRMNGMVNMVVTKKSFKSVTEFSDYR